MNSNKAVASLVLGLVGIVAWIIPLCGYPVTIVGLVMGIKGLNSEKRNMAIAGIVLCIIFLIACIINSVIGAIIGVQMASDIASYGRYIR